jgi:pimeloyl-ACP methyl ester carboxylesterase
MAFRSRSIIDTLRLLFAGMAMCLAACGSDADLHDAASSCLELSIPVSMADGMSKDQAIYAQLCVPGEKTPRVLQILVHGITYDHSYWDMPGFDGHYSYVAAMNAAGYATLAIDRVGSGKSTHPLSATLQIYSNAWLLHQVVQTVREGGLPGAPWTSVVIVGHSYGSVIAEQEVASYQDADGLIATGALWHPNVVQFSRPIINAYPAGLDPKFPELLSDPGYLTSRPGSRGVFYEGGSYDPEVLAVDEQIKQTVTITEMSTSSLPELSLVYSRIKVPTLLIVGDHDVFYCTPLGFADCSSSEALLQDQQSLFPPEAQLRAYVQEDSGHSINLVTNNQAGFAAVISWLDEFFQP